MTEGVAERVKRLLHEHPDAEVRFTAAVTGDSYLFSMSSGRPAIFVHPLHEQLVTDLRRAHAAHVAPTATA